VLFSSYEFVLLFLPASVAFYFLAQRLEQGNLAKAGLYLFSLFFYGYWDWRFLPLLIGSSLVNFYIGELLGRTTRAGRRDRRVLLLGVALNLGLLGFFKYTNFFIDNLNAVTGSSVAFISVVLPVGISFFTFQQIAYLVDAYRGQTSEYRVLDYCVFVAFFPQLIAGPIVHHKEMMPQFEDLANRRPRLDNICRGAFIFAIGFWKKTVIADTVAIWASEGFADPSALNFVEAWVAALSYTFQIYFDFSGYADMAIGAALMFNIVLPVNFYSPYKALSIRDFWRRWHVSLSRFLRDYVYIPLGGNTRGDFIMCRNFVITFLLGGLWHGAGWTFVIWGALHGVGLVIHRVWSGFGGRLPVPLAWLVTFLFVVVTWVFFRAASLPDAIAMLSAMVGLNGVVLPPQLAGVLGFLNGYGVEFGTYWFTKIDWETAKFSFLLLPALLGFVLIFRNSIEHLQEFRPSWRHGIVLAGAFSLALALVHREAEFIYYQF
jgi:alginate O-acetyltransferase complex protein AlgI